MPKIDIIIVLHVLNHKCGNYVIFSYFILCKKEYQEIRKIMLLETKILEKNYYFSCISMNNQ